MKITKESLKKFIKEELEKVTEELNPLEKEKELKNNIESYLSSIEEKKKDFAIDALISFLNYQRQSTKDKMALAKARQTKKNLPFRSYTP